MKGQMFTPFVILDPYIFLNISRLW